MALREAITAARTAKETLQAVHDKLDQIILRKLSDGENTDEENEERTRISSQITQQDFLLANLAAAQSVVSSPTIAEINEVAGLLNQVRNLAVQDAMLAQGRAILTQAASSAIGLGVLHALTPLPQPTEKELRAIIAASGSLTRRQTSEDEEMVRHVIAEYRAEKRRK